MAIDKNSKAYQSLLKSWYTDEQITQMHQQTSSGQSAKEVIANNTPTNSPTTNGTASNVDRSWDQWDGNYVYNPSILERKNEIERNDIMRKNEQLELQLLINQKLLNKKHL